MIEYIVQRYTSREQAPGLNICLKLRSLILNREKIFIRAYFPGTNLTLIWQRDFLRESTVVNGVQTCHWRTGEAAWFPANDWKGKTWPTPLKRLVGISRNLLKS